jgi:hypothetical protein
MFEISSDGGTADDQSRAAMIQLTVAFVVWQSVTAACLSLALTGQRTAQPSKSGAAKVADDFGPDAQ